MANQEKQNYTALENIVLRKLQTRIYVGLGNFKN
jgi:hypothetical protein